MTDYAAALAAGDSAVWGIIDAHANRLGGVAAGRGAEPEDALQEMRLKVWRAAATGRATFPTPGALVGYANSAMYSVAIDARRRAAVRIDALRAPLDAADWRGVGSPSPAADDWRRALWDELRPHLRSEAEEVAILTLAEGTPLREAARCWPGLFTDERAVFNARRNVMGRIQRSAATIAALRELREGI